LPKSLSPAYALPTAAAVTLALTAVGATAAQSSSVPGAAPQTESAQAALSANALLNDPQLAESARTEVAVAAQDSAGLSERRRAVSASVAEQQGRAQEKASRDKKRKAIAKAKKEAAPTWVRPLANAPRTSGYGLRWGRLHAGIDYGAPVGTPLRSMGTGTVVAAGPMGGYGVYIDIEYTDGTVSRYGHLSSISASVGQQVAPGDLVGHTGNTGRSTGPHLHLEIRPGGGGPIDPAGWLAERGIY
jgi:murein DD-endopeptidase MepM/ murein hydrolase activator NlpD